MPIFAVSLGWGDSAYHLDMIGRLKTVDPFMLEHPVISGEQAASESPLNIVWIVTTISFFSHQRSFATGASLALLIFLGFISSRRDLNIWRWVIVWGIIPFWHTHSFIAFSIIIFWLVFL